MTEFVALYRGRTVSEAELVAVSAQPELVRRFLLELLGEASSSDKKADRARLETVRVAASDRE